MTRLTDLDPVYLGAIASFTLETTLIADKVGFFSVDISPDNPPDGFDWSILKQVEQLSKCDRLLLVTRIVNRLMGLVDVMMPSESKRVA
ncbi:MAG: hypothetical protein AB4042_02685 [Leptolyngbyaceae cyanobacterium]